MSRKAACALIAAIAAPAISLSTATLTSAAPVDPDAACNAAPKPAAAQGSHWYYRIDRASGRKCWYLAAEGQKVRTAPRIVPRTRISSAPAAPPVIEAAQERQTRPAGLRLTDPPAQPTEPADAVSPTAPAAPSAAASDSVADFKDQARIPAALERANEDAQVLRALEERRAQLPPSQANAAGISAGAPISMSQISLIVFAAICLLASAVLHAAAARRRRTLVQIVDLGAKAPLRRPVTVGSASAPRRAPADDGAKVDQERLRQFARAWKQRAA